MKSDVAVRVQHVAKDFHLPRHHSNSLKETITQVFKPKDKGVDVHHALKDISFEVKKGEFFGILGRNGSGKSTLLKIISEIYRPTRGTVEHDGTLVSFIELGVGFKPELSGRENVFLNGALLGFSKAEIEEMYDEIVGFAELEEFMEQKLKNYSSGMKVRLAFSVAIRAKSDILVLDEVLAVGDAAFQRKCYDYFKSLKDDDSKTIIFVTHGMGAVRDYCDRAILIEDGLIKFEGEASDVADEYTKLFDRRDHETADGAAKENDDHDKPSIRAKVVDSVVLNNTDTLEVDVIYKNIDERQVYPKIVLYYKNVPVMASNAKIQYGITTNDTLEHILRYKIPLINFNQGEVNIGAILVDSANDKNVAEIDKNSRPTFMIKNTETGDKIGGIFRDLGSLEIR